MEREVKILELYINFYRSVVNNAVTSDESKEIKSLLKLNKTEDWNFICSAMDIVGDSLIAIENFLDFGLFGPTKIENDGEKYLRLYGLLNATYLQQNAIKKLYRLSKLPDRKTDFEKINNLEIRVVRNKLGAHSIDYKNKNGDCETIESYVPIRIMMTEFGCEFLSNLGNISENIDLKNGVFEHLKLMTSLLDKICNKVYRTIFKGKEIQLNEFKEELDTLRLEKDEKAVILRTPDNQIIYTIFRIDPN